MNTTRRQIYLAYKQLNSILIQFLSKICSSIDFVKFVFSQWSVELKVCLINLGLQSHIGYMSKSSGQDGKCCTLIGTASTL